MRCLCGQPTIIEPLGYGFSIGLGDRQEGSTPATTARTEFLALLKCDHASPGFNLRTAAEASATGILHGVAGVSSVPT